MSEFEVGDVVRVLSSNCYGTSASGVTTEVKQVTIRTDGVLLFHLDIPNHGDLVFIENELSLVKRATPGVSLTKEQAFRKAVELSPNALLEDQILLAEWLMK